MSGRYASSLRTWCVTAVIAAIAGALPAPPAAAHPMGNFSINHYAAIALEPDRIELRYLIDMAEIPTFQEMHEHSFAADPGTPGVASYLKGKCRELREGLVLELGGQRIELRELGHDVIFPPGAGGLPTMKLRMRLEADLAPARLGAARLDYSDLNFPGRAGWKEVIATAQGSAALAESSVPDRDRSAELTNYPVDLLSSPPQVLEAHLRPVMLAAVAGGPRPVAQSADRVPLRANQLGTPRNAFTQLMTVRQPGLWFLLTAALIAIALGALHALEPGHGKTVVAAYLVGSRGTARHALMLAATVTASHTAAVYALGGLTLYASHWIIPERIYPWLGGVSGLIVAALGMGLFVKRLRGNPYPHPNPLPGQGEGTRRSQGEGIRKLAYGKGIGTTAYDEGVAFSDLACAEPGLATVAQSVMREPFLSPHSPSLMREHFLSPNSHSVVGEGEGEGAGTLQAETHHHFHEHDGNHAHDRDHAHDGHDAAHGHTDHFHPHRHDIFGRHVEPAHDGGAAHRPVEGEHLSLRSLLALGVTGGIVPCPAALVVLLSALSLNRVGFGLFLIVAFSAGLAAVLIGFGLTVVYARRFVTRYLRLEGNLTARWLPLISSAVITVAGVAIAVQALSNGGVLRVGR